MLPLLFVPLVLGIFFIVASISLKEKVGIVCSVEKVQTSYTQTIIDGEIEQVPIYSYLVLFQTEDGEYRILTTTNIDYGILKEGDSITYTLDGTEKIKERGKRMERKAEPVEKRFCIRNFRRNWWRV